MCAGTRRARVPVLQPGVAATKPRLHVRAPTQEDLAPPPRHRQLLTGTGSGEGHPAPRGPAPLTPQVTPQLAGWDPSLLGAPRSCSQWGVTSCSGGNSRVDPGPSKRPGCELQLWVGPPAVAWTASWNARVTDLPPTAPQAENLDLGPSASRPPPQTRRPLREASQHVGRGGRAECRRPQAPRWLGRAGGGLGRAVASQGPGSASSMQASLPEPLLGPSPTAHSFGEKECTSGGNRQLIFNVTWVPETTRWLMSQAAWARAGRGGSEPRPGAGGGRVGCGAGPRPGAAPPGPPQDTCVACAQTSRPAGQTGWPSHQPHSFPEAVWGLDRHLRPLLGAPGTWAVDEGSSEG